MKIHCYIFWILFSLTSCSWMPWWHDDFKANSELEDEYVSQFGNEEVYFDDEDTSQKWTAVRKFYNQSSLGRLIRFCALAHKQAGRGTVSVNAIKLEARTLSFENPFYESRTVDVITYGVKNETDVTTDYWDLVVGPQNYITEGLRPDCVCYLILLSSLKMEFSLYEHVCGINVTGITDVVPERKLKKKTAGATKTTRKTTKKATIAKKILKIKRTTLGESTFEEPTFEEPTFEESTFEETTVKKSTVKRSTVKKSSSKISTTKNSTPAAKVKNTRRRPITDTWS